MTKACPNWPDGALQLSKERKIRQNARLRLEMHGIPVLEKYRYILCFKRYDIIILLNSVFYTLQLQNAPVDGSASQIAAQPVNVTTEHDGSNR